MKRSTALTYAGAALIIGVILLMTDSDRSAEAKAEAQMKARLFTKFSDPAIAQMAAPLAGDH
ncbi:hypothetical protein [Herbaspirillum huttiense]|uniref:hypothetical protein n=1 Tax=Herbaspirillum huttiense TaxID=863372 RepID=UPI0031CFAE09